MKILRQGTEPGTIPQAVECQHCTALIEFTPNEVHRVSDQRDGDYYQMNCPFCGGIITKSVSRGYNGPG